VKNIGQQLQQYQQNEQLQNTDHKKTSAYADGNSYHCIEQAEQTPVNLIQALPPYD